MSVPEPGPEHVQTSVPGAQASTLPPPASTGAEIGQEGSRRLLILGIGLTVLVGGAAVALFATSRSVPTTTATTTTGENSPTQVLRPLTRQRDLTTCRNALQQLNILLSNSQPRPFSWQPEDRKAVAEALGLDAKDQADLDARDFTLLDGQYLDGCLLFRDAARTLNGGDTEDPTEPLEGARASLEGARTGFPQTVLQLLQRRLHLIRLEQARAAFAWSVRQVRMQPHSTYVTPVEFTLRRGSGTDLERALVFLALLRQLGPEGALTGALVFCKDGAGKELLWACGVVVAGDDRLYLFDPRLGLPIPGPGGVGVASLKETVQDPTVLGQLTVDSHYPYDVSPERAAGAEVRQFAPLSGLSPRARYLEDQLQTASVPVHLRVDALADKERLSRAARASLGDKARVEPWEMEIVEGGGREKVKKKVAGASILRRFLPENEGGMGLSVPVDIYGRSREVPVRDLFQLELLQGNLPAPFNDRLRFPIEVGLGQRVWNRYASYFLEPLLQPGKPRDLMLRGDFAAAGPKIREDIAQLDDRVERAANDPELRQRVDKWLEEKAIPAYSNLVEEENKKGYGDSDELAEARRAADAVWVNQLDPRVLLDAGSAQNVLPELAYLQALCKHEEAEQLQARIENQRNRHAVPNKDELEEAAHRLAGGPGTLARLPGGPVARQAQRGPHRLLPLLCPGHPAVRRPALARRRLLSRPGRGGGPALAERHLLWRPLRRGSPASALQTPRGTGEGPRRPERPRGGSGPEPGSVRRCRTPRRPVRDAPTAQATVSAEWRPALRSEHAPPWKAWFRRRRTAKPGLRRCRFRRLLQNFCLGADFPLTGNLRVITLTLDSQRRFATDPVCSPAKSAGEIPKTELLRAVFVGG